MSKFAGKPILIMKKPILSLLLLFIVLTASANEGMWIPSLLKALNEQDLKERGLKIPVEQIWSVNQPSLKDAIVRFGGGCTAEVVSYNGLLLTNHHCGFAQVQAHSSVEHDYLKNGFWAMSYGEELPNPGLTATFVVRMDDVTQEVLDHAIDEDGKINETVIKNNIKKIVKGATEGTKFEAEVKEFNYGNSYFLIVTETFRDVRLVGAPPSAIGKFGGDTDNWVWPRHTGDFSVFRIYADKNNQPADYSPDNVPYKPKYALSVSNRGVHENDFTMVFGFPGRTQEFLSAAAVNQIVMNTNPARISMREKALNIIDADMKSSDKIRIQYAAKQARISNAYKKWIGETKGLIRMNAVDRKRALEHEYVKLAKSNPLFTKKYAGLPAAFDELYKRLAPYAAANDYFFELIYSGPEFFRYVQRMEGVVENYNDATKKDAIQQSLGKNKAGIAGFFKDYNSSTDKKLFENLFPMYVTGTPAELLPDGLMEYKKKYKDNWSLLADEIFTKSFFTDEKRMEGLLKNFSAKSVKKVKADPAYRLMKLIFDGYRQKVDENFNKYQDQSEAMMHDFVEGMMVLFPDKKYWYDANSTLRLAYGVVEGSSPHDGMKYTYYTTMTGMLDKYIPGDTEFDLPARLIELAKKKDFGDYGENGDLRICFTASNHTTGGNSGSPVLDAYGNLIGLNFDRSWESTMSDVMFDPAICRNIILDIRYVMFVMDKYAGAGHLVKEMNVITDAKMEEMEKAHQREEINRLTGAIKADPKNITLLKQRISLLRRLCEDEAAMNDVKTGLSIAPGDIELQVTECELMMDSGKYKDALKKLDGLLKKYPGADDAVFDRALCQSELKMFDAAIKSYTDYIQLHSMDARAYYNRGVCYYNSGKTIEGCADFMVAEKLSGQKNTWLREQLCN